MEHDDMIEALAANRSNHSFYRCRQNFADAHVSHLFSEAIAKNRIAVAQQVARELVKGNASRIELLSLLFRGWVSGHIEMQNAAPVMGQH
jgi:hypothetical protein